jgi:2-oxoglutarate ferredoxin oxidoreductase subunit alpha
MQALFGRNGECPVIVIAASSPANCFYFAYIAAKISMEHMTPVILLTDGNIGNGSQLFRIPKVADLPDIHPPMAKANDPDFSPYKRDAEKLVRQWAIPGTEGLRHRVGGLEKENIIGNVSTDPMNHQIMTDLRQAKVDMVADYIPLQEVYGEQEGDLLVITWGSTEGAAREAVDELLEDGKKIGQVHLSYIMPLPKNIAEIFASFRKIIVCELNSGQMVMYLRMMHPQFKYDKYNKVQGLPFTVSELTEVFKLKLQEE